jgi:hypothetical protein
MKIDPLNNKPLEKESFIKKCIGAFQTYFTNDSVMISENEKIESEQQNINNIEEENKTPFKQSVIKQEQVPTVIAQISPDDEIIDKDAIFTYELINKNGEIYRKLYDEENSVKYNKIKDEFFSDIFADDELKSEIEYLVHKWTYSETSLEPLKNAFVDVFLKGKSPETENENYMFNIISTRKERWDRLSKKLNIKTPEKFHLFRGVHGDYAVESVINAWKDENTKNMNLPNRVLSSWSVSKNTAEMFAKFQTPVNGVVYEADIPFTRTFMDKWVDDADFIKYFYAEDEVIVMASENSIKIDKKNAKVKYDNKLYDYDKRKELIDIWNEKHKGSSK